LAWLFYASFGVVVTSSVRIAGVLLVFSYLIVPALAGIALSRSVASRLWIGWAFGALDLRRGVAHRSLRRWAFWGSRDGEPDPL
jgi:zinc/manganese transport system permease protein